ncbi:MAG TPA: ATP-binding protein, partial [Longimicrobium sp.]|nr:ATP-binding protein [Longimicrobium sp.]
ALDGEARFVELNPAGERVLARAQADVVGRNFAEVVAPRDLAAARRAYRALISGERAELEIETHIVQPSGAERLLAVTLAATRKDGEVTGADGIARDITGEREAERHLGRAERLATVGTLLAGVAHELNNPLTAIKSFAGLMLLDEHTTDDREALETMRREADRAANIVADLRVLVRQTHESHEAPREAVDLNEVVRHVLRVRAYPLATRNVSVSEKLAVGLPPVLGPRGQVEQVVMNLVVNAEQAMEQLSGGGRLELRTRRVGDGAELDVADTGPGIAPEHLERIFDPFFTTKAPGEGTGLGLALIHRIVTEHGGHVRVASAPGEGTTFTVDLPLAPVRAARAAAAAEVEPPARALRVLIVDDEPAIRRSVVRYLARRGHVADEAADGEAALRAIAKAASDDQYDVILSDLRMPGLGGAELLAHLRRADPALAERLIFFTGDASSEAAGRILAEAGVPVLVKPFELANLAAVVEWHGRLRPALDSVHQIGRVMLEQAEQIRRAVIVRLRYDAEVPRTTGMTDSDLEAHTCTLITDLAQSLTIVGDVGTDARHLLDDGKNLLHFIAELQGAQRARLGWSESALSREYQILREEIGAALREHARPGHELGVAEALRLLDPLLDEAEQITRSALRAATHS